MREVLGIAAFLVDRGLEFSVHNPAGPVLDAVMLVAAACAPAVTMVERQYREHELHETLLAPPLAMPVGGEVMAPRAPGWGVDLDRAMLAMAAGMPAAGADPLGLSGAGSNG